ncbi:hypothetical protein U771_01345 [Pseudomonas gorinensis]|jgi:hypothetical protein|uniref:Uncharacterized protein n=1 Tax=Pseudomonas gorinensis TaxID=3240790 RepID=A0ACA7NYQ9_9PSED|nr:hypothetical protein U771_01345 [Pseudomonas sp. TKP]
MPEKHQKTALGRQATDYEALAPAGIFLIQIRSIYNFKDYFKR